MAKPLTPTHTVIINNGENIDILRDGPWFVEVVDGLAGKRFFFTEDWYTVYEVHTSRVEGWTKLHDFWFGRRALVPIGILEVFDAPPARYAA